MPTLLDMGASFPAKAVEQRQLPEWVATHLREQILSGRLRNGEFLRIDALAKTLGVSTTPVREGLLLLQSESFVRLLSRRGFVVNGFSKDTCTTCHGHRQPSAPSLLHALRKDVQDRRRTGPASSRRVR